MLLAINSHIDQKKNEAASGYKSLTVSLCFIYIYTKLLKIKKFRNVTYEGFHSNRRGQRLHIYTLYTVFEDSYHFNRFIGGCYLYINLLSQERLNHRKLLDSAALSHSVAMATG